MTREQFQLVMDAEKTIVTDANGNVIRIDRAAAIRAVLKGASTVVAVVSNALAEKALAEV